VFRSGFEKRSSAQRGRLTGAVFEKRAGRGGVRERNALIPKDDTSELPRQRQSRDEIADRLFFTLSARARARPLASPRKRVGQ